MGEQAQESYSLSTEPSSPSVPGCANQSEPMRCDERAPALPVEDGHQPVRPSRPPVASPVAQKTGFYLIREAYGPLPLSSSLGGCTGMYKMCGSDGWEMIMKWFGGRKRTIAKG